MLSRFKIYKAHDRYRIKEEIHPGYWAWMTSSTYPFEVVEFITSSGAEMFIDEYVKALAEEWKFYEEVDYMGDTRTPHKSHQDLEGTSPRELPRDGSKQGDQDREICPPEVPLDEHSGGVGEDQ